MEISHGQKSINLNQTNLTLHEFLVDIATNKICCERCEIILYIS